LYPTTGLHPHLFPAFLPTAYLVNGDTGNDSNAGTTLGGALKTIAAGIAKAGSGPAVVLVAAATAAGSEIAGTTNSANSNLPYRGYDAGTGTNLMVNTVSLCGGFSSDFSERDPAAHETVIASTATTGGIGFATLATPISADATVTPATVLEGFTLVAAGPDTVAGFSGSNAGALTVGGGLQVRNNKMIGGGTSTSVIAYVHDNTSASAQALFSNNYLTGAPTSSFSSRGFYVANATPVFAGGYIGTTSAAGVWIDNDPGVVTVGTVTISNSDIDGGASNGTNYGIFVNQGDVAILNNDEISGGGLVGGGVGTAAAIYFGGGSGTVFNNLIFGGSAQDNVGIYISLSAGTVTLTENNIFGGDGNTSTGVDDFGTDTTLEHNSIHGHSSAATAIAIRSTGAGTRKYVRNQIMGGVSGGSNTGILLASNTAGVLVRSNLMTGCQGYPGFFGQGPCVAIDNNGTGNKFYNNTVNGGSGAQAPKSIAYRQGSLASGSDIRNNLFFTSADGVLGAPGGRCMDVYDSAGVSAIPNNDLFSCGGSYYFDQLLAQEFTVSDPIPSLGGATLTSVQNKQDIDPGFVSIGTNPGQLGTADVDWHLQASSPPEVRGGGQMLGCGFNLDYDGVAYTGDITAGGGSSMGAYVSPTQYPSSDCGL
jgi:hypothetical protein